MRPAHPPDPRNVDRRVARAHSRHTSYTNERLEALGVSSPPRSGWRPLAAVPTLVEVHGVYLRNYSLALYDCSDHFKYVNGGAPYPNNQVFCDNVGDILAVGTTTGQIHIEFDQDWQAKGLCGPAVRSCDTI